MSDLSASVASMTRRQDRLVTEWDHEIAFFFESLKQTTNETSIDKCAEFEDSSSAVPPEEILVPSSLEVAPLQLRRD
jgi:hypothetical protein